MCVVHIVKSVSPNQEECGVCREGEGKKNKIMSPATSTRWCPTAEQLMILEEMYKAGIRTPNASQIQQITAHLSFYGKIEGKNVFYWFQNHKARDRQKLRRKLTRQHPQQQTQHYHHHYNLLPHIDQYHQTAVAAGAAAVPSTASLQQYPHHHYNSPQFLLPQDGVILQEEPAQVMNYTWKVDIPQSKEEMMEKSTRMYACDWMMMMDMSPTFPYSNTSRPLKTLELFPIKSTNLRDECTSSKTPPPPSRYHQARAA